MADSSDSAASAASGDAGEPGASTTGDQHDGGQTEPEQPESGQAPYGQTPYGQTPYSQYPYGQTPYSQAPYGQQPYGQAPYGQSPYGQAPYEQSPYGQSPYGGGYPPSPYAASPYGQWVPPAPKPGIIPLRPLSVGEILDGAFTAMRRNPMATLGFSAIVMTVYGVIVSGTSIALTHLVRGVQQPTFGQKFTSAQAAYFAKVELPDLAVVLVMTFLITTILTGMLVSVVGHSVLGRQISIGEAWRLTRPRLGALVGNVLLAWLVVFGTVVIGSLVAVLIGAIFIAVHVTPVGVIVMVLGIGASVVFGVIFFVRFALSPGAVVLEGLGPAMSLRRSWRLVRKSSWRVFGILLLVEVIVLVATGVLQVPFSVIAAVVGHGSGSGGIVIFGSGGASGGGSVLAEVIAGIGGIVAGTVARPVVAGAQALLYVDLRMRREGLDITLQSAASDQPGQTAFEFGDVWTGTGPRAGQPGPQAAQAAESGTATAPETGAGPETGAVPPPDQQRW